MKVYVIPILFLCTTLPSCLPLCLTAYDCGDGLACAASEGSHPVGECVATCTTDTECGFTEACDNGTCVDSCSQSPSSCPPWVYDDGSSHLLNFADSIARIEVHDSAAGAPTTVHVAGGNYDAVIAYDHSVVKVSRGTITGHSDGFLTLGDNSTADITGGSGRLAIRDNATASIAGGDWAFGSPVFVWGSATVTITGGTFYQLEVTNSSHVTLVGTDFNFPPGDIHAANLDSPFLIVTGTFGDGTPFSIEFLLLHNTTLTLAPPAP